MRHLKYAMLGLINRKPISGYDIMKEFNKGLVNFWTAKHSQIYPELKKLVEEGLLEFQVEITGEVLEKKMYSITEKGQKDFLDWLNQIEDIEPTPKEVFRLRLYFANHMDKANYRKALKHHLGQREEKLVRLCKEKDDYKEIPEIESNAFGDYLVLKGAVLREEASIQWLKECLEII